MIGCYIFCEQKTYKADIHSNKTRIRIYTKLEYNIKIKWIVLSEIDIFNF